MEIKWYEHINEDEVMRSDQLSVVQKVKLSMRRNYGHTSRMGNERHPKLELSCTPEGKLREICR